MKVGATEKTFFELWHPDADNLFNVSSSLRRVCWELHDPRIRLDGDRYEITLMQCFQPQLAAFQMQSFEKMVSKMKLTEEDPVFWIEEKMDGERMQLHMVEDESIPGGKRFAFWSRKAKDYTYLYGNSFEDDNSALTRHLRDAFKDTVRNIILDGEMITWDMEEDAVVAFGTLKTAALSEQRNPFSTGQRPLFRVFDCLYLNDVAITRYTLRDRRRALEASIKPVHRRLEIHSYKEAHNASEIEPILRQVVAEASEGLVLKNPRSMYRLNERNDDWIKVKPEYMTEFGEALDCIVIGGYYGSGNRGGQISSMLCGLRVDQNQIQQGANPQKCYSFFKVGGGFSAGDYAEIRHRTEDKWIRWDPKRPPTEYIELGGGDRQFERPDVWIKPEESVVVSAKASSVATTDQFRVGMTLRFPRFKKLRLDKDWKSALSIQEFIELKANVEKEVEEKKMEIDDERKKRRAPQRKRKRSLVIVGQDDEFKIPYAGRDTKVFGGLNFFIITESLKPEKKSKAELEEMVKVNGGTIVQSQNAKENVICIADREPIKVRSIKKEGKMNIVRPSWLFDCIKQSEIDFGRPQFLLPMEPNHMYFTTDQERDMIDRNVDEFGDSYCRDIIPNELQQIFDNMPKLKSRDEMPTLLEQLHDHGVNLEELPGFMFYGVVAYVEGQDQVDVNSNASDETGSNVLLRLASQTMRFAGGRVVMGIDNPSITHVVIGNDAARVKEIRHQFTQRPKIPRIVTPEWVLESWKEKTLLDEERFIP
jgi:DNA ligase-4